VVVIDSARLSPLQKAGDRAVLPLEIMTELACRWPKIPEDTAHGAKIN
jgi:hypothetical protein